MKVYKRRLLRRHSQRNMYREMKEEITSKKKQTIQSQKKLPDGEGQETIAFFILRILNRFLSTE